MYDAIMAERALRSVDFAACFAKLPALLAAPPEEALSARGLGEGWVAEEAVASALYAFWRTPTDFARTVCTAANTDGDSDSIASIAGGISGAFNGRAAIPARWCSTVEGGDPLCDLARALHANTEIDQEIPAGLYVAVAQLLAYVYALRRAQTDGGPTPDRPVIDVPAEPAPRPH